VLGPTRFWANDYKTSADPFLKQLNRLENAGILVSRTVGRTRLYPFNPKSPFVTPIRRIVEIVYDSMPLPEKELVFQTRRRPRRKGKPVLYLTPAKDLAPRPNQPLDLGVSEGDGTGLGTDPASAAGFGRGGMNTPLASA